MKSLLQWDGRWTVWVKNMVFLKLARDASEIQKEYCEQMDLPLLQKKKVRKPCKGYGAICTEMSGMYGGFATAEKDDSWKSRSTGDDYLAMLTLR